MFELQVQVVLSNNLNLTFMHDPLDKQGCPLTANEQVDFILLYNLQDKSMPRFVFFSVANRIMMIFFFLC